MSKIKVIVDALENLKLKDIIVYDMRERSPFFDYFVLSTASNSRQLKAAINHLKENLSASKFQIPNVEGAHSDAWILLDAKDVIVNVFTEEERKYYNLEKMWMDVDQIDVHKV